MHDDALTDSRYITWVGGGQKIFSPFEIGITPLKHVGKHPKDFNIREPKSKKVRTREFR